MSEWGTCKHAVPKGLSCLKCEREWADALAAENEALRKELEQARKEIAGWEESFDVTTSEYLRVTMGLRDELKKARQRIARLESDLIRREGDVERLERRLSGERS